MSNKNATPILFEYLQSFI